ncbi:conserved hypothetical protein [Frankia sp. AiPs1]|uniref:hypothetical protein n=1 Tax=Frankia sp. AiPa1 TaxID=573492 RepID=UPI00202B0553|nr:hypothetical protein [Frankia sp. AiPa1]MCL9761907.1 hypothetical protein [Frankia sp. AiPa1]
MSRYAPTSTDDHADSPRAHPDDAGLDGLATEPTAGRRTPDGQAPDGQAPDGQARGYPPSGCGSHHRTREALDDDTAEAVGRLSEALEWVERARGALYEFHQLSGHADLVLGDAVDQLTNSGHRRSADLLRERLLGRNVLDGRWTFQIVEEYDDLYYRPFVEVDEEVRRRLTGGQRHVHEARMKARERTRAGRDPWGPGP